MKILINAIGDRMGGAETFLCNLLPRLARSSDEAHFTLIIRQSRRHLYRGFPPNIEVQEIPDSLVNTPFRRLWFEHKQIPQQNLTGSYALHFQSDEMLSPVIPISGQRSLSVFHSSPMVLFGNISGDGFWFERYARLIRRRTAARATLPVTVSHHAKAEFSGLFPFARDRFRVVYHGVDQNIFYPAPSKNRILSVKGIGAPYLLSVSNRFIWKNYFRLIQAYQRVISEQQVNCDLVLVGKGKLEAEEKRIAQYLKEHELSKRVHLLDYIEHHSLPEIYRGALAYVFPSLRETFGLTVLEAMASGLPVACARWGPLPEVAGDAAYYFDPLRVDSMAEAMAVVATDETIRREYSRRGIEHVRYFTWERAAEEYRRLILEAVQSDPGRRWI